MSAATGAPAGAAPDPKKKKTLLVGCLIALGVLFCLVIPIVGVLAAIAVPNYLKFVCKAKQTEMKANLQTLRLSEKAFFAEHGYFTSDLQALRWKPQGGRYIYGFAESGPGDVKKTEQPEDYDESRSSSLSLDGFDHSKTVNGHGDALTVDDLPSGTLVTREKFVAGAAADLGSGMGGLLDVWTVDESGALKAESDTCGARRVSAE